MTGYEGNSKTVSEQDLRRQLIAKQHLGGLAALKVLALVAVCAYHLRSDIFVGGFFAVDLFFVITAYLTTQKLLQNWQKLQLRRFYLHRLHTLWPPLAVMCTFVLLLAFSAVPKLMQNILPNYLSSLVFMNNFWQIYLGDSYFAEAVSPSAFKHLWYIAILGQMTIIWPAVFKLFALCHRSRLTLQKNLSRFLLVVIILSAAFMFFQYKPGSDPTVVYYSTLTRAYAYAVGALAGVLFPVEKLNFLAYGTSYPDLTGKLQLRSHVRFFDLAVLPLLCIVPLLWLILPADSPFVYRGALLINSLLCAALTVCVMLPQTWWGRFFDSPGFRYVAKKAYEYYLWQYAIMILLREGLTTVALDRNVILIINIVLTVIAAEFAYRYVHAFKWHSLKQEFTDGKIRLQTLARLTVAVFFLCGIVPALLNSKPVSLEAGQAYREQIKQAALTQEQVAEENEQQPETTQETAKATPAPTESAQTLKNEKGPYDLATMQKMTESDLTAEEKQALSEIQVSAVGDSVLLGCSNAITKLIPHFRYRAKESAQVDQAVKELQKMADNKKLGDIVLLAVGQNGFFTRRQAETLLKIADGRPVLVYTIYVGKEWEGANNKIWQDLAQEHAELELIDWHTLAKNRRNLLWDGIHPNNDGQVIYARLFARTLLRRLGKSTI